MLEYLQGNVVEMTDVGKVVIELQNGAAYRVLMPPNNLPKSLGPCKILVHHHKTETADHLFGFLTENERIFFNLLIAKCDKVGPKVAMSVMTLGTPDAVMQAIRMQNTAFLERAKGVSDTTAKNICLGLSKIGKK